jgi:hypothetical protein
MTEAVASKTFWNLPRVTTESDGLTRIDFRDCLVDIDSGLVSSYFDKLRAVVLRPSNQMDSWEVFSEGGQSTGQYWRGIIIFDGSQLLIQQTRNALFRLYRTDGTIETQLRMSRVIEKPGQRSILFQTGQRIEEDLEGQRTVSHWGDRIVLRGWGGEKIVCDDRGNVIDQAPKPVVEANPVLEVFARLLQPWSSFSPNGAGDYAYAGPPGLAEAAPGEIFDILVEGKPNDVRECVTHDFEDGTLLHEYAGRLNGPFLAHEVVTCDGLVLVRSIEYDQPRSINFFDPRGTVRQHDKVLSVEVQYDPGTNEYITCITDSEGKQFVHPKGAHFERNQAL